MYLKGGFDPLSIEKFDLIESNEFGCFYQEKAPDLSLNPEVIICRQFRLWMWAEPFFLYLTK
jgi:hypothetical protein